jgi:hypothetical protein
LLVAGGTSGQFTVVDFDVSVVAEHKAGGKGGLKVWGVGLLEREAGRSSQHTSRVKFSVHLRIPQGGKAPKSQSNIPPDPKDDKALHTALDLIRGIHKKSAYPPTPRTAIPNWGCARPRPEAESRTVNEMATPS